MNKVLSLVFILIAIFGILLSVGGIVITRRAINGIEVGLDQTLQLTADTLDNVEATLLLTKVTIEQVNDSLNTVGQTAQNVSTTLTATQPLLDQVTEVATGDVPDSLESIQNAIPNVAEAAGAIDDTLRILNSFKVDRTIFGIPIAFDLGINYQPEEPLDETVSVLGESLDGIPDELRGLETNLLIANENLGVIGQNLDVLSGDLNQINATLAEIDPLVDEYIRLTTETSELIRTTQTQLDDQLLLANYALTGLFIWIGLSQIVPLYLGWMLLRGKEKELMVIESQRSEGKVQSSDPHIRSDSIPELDEREKLSNQTNDFDAEDDA